MKRLFFTILSGCIAVSGYAQPIVANDSALTGSGNISRTYYQLGSAAKTTTPNNDWNLALSVQQSQFPNNTMQGATLRINEANGTKVYEIPGFTADSSQAIVDTTGYHSWTQLHDADTSLDYGALNAGTNINAFFYGWGTYAGPPTHNVVGSKVFLFELPNGSLKKFFVQSLDRDTAWNIQYSDIDNSNLQNLHISKMGNIGKEFVYLNMTTNAVDASEPLAANWDLLFLKYAATNVMPGNVYGVVGVWANKGVTVAKAEGVDVRSNDISGLTFSAALNGIGFDWKRYDNQLGQYVIADSLAYFVKTRSGDIYKLIFTGFGGSATGVVSFYSELLQGGTGIKTNNIFQPTIYPNPTQSVLHLLLPDNAEQATIRLTNMSGQVVKEEVSSNKNVQIDVSSLAKGVYVVSVVNASVSGRTTLVIQ